VIPRLRRKFILIATLCVLGTLTALCVAIGVSNYRATAGRADLIISTLYQNGGKFPSPERPVDPITRGDFQITSETPFETRYFIVELTARQEVVSVNIEHIAAQDRQTVVACVNEILESGEERGYIDYYRFGVFEDPDGGSTVIVLDRFLQLQTTYHMIRITLLASLACTLVVFLLLVVLSKRAIRPYVENLERQRQFVTDASHELKTPLAILSADLSLMADTYGENEWFGSAQAQVGRLDRLIKNLVELARTEESVKEAAMAEFSLSEVAQANVDAFRPLAESEGKALTAAIAPDLTLRGVQDNFFRLFSILLDNAVKYCDPGGTIRLSLQPQGRTLRLTLSNPCAGVDPSQLNRWFDRFYRADSSRARATGGYGIGLSTAKAIVTRHKGKLTAHYTDGTVTFTATLPRGEP